MLNIYNSAILEIISNYFLVEVNYICFDHHGYFYLGGASSKLVSSCLCYLTSVFTMCSYFDFCWGWGSLILAWSCWFQCLLNNKLIHNICSNICVYLSKFVSTKSISLTSGDCYILCTIIDWLKYQSLLWFN